MKEKPFKKLIAVATSFLMLSCGTDYGKFSIFASEFDELENNPPSVMGIPGESIDEGKKFAPLKLDKYVTDEDSANAIKWSVSGNKYLKVSISADHIATIEIPDHYWNGSEDITFIATDTKGAEGSETVRFTVNSVNNPPEVQKIPDQTVNEGHTFTGIKLDDYVTDPDHPKNKIRWTCKITPIGTDQAIGDLTVEIDPNRVATVIIPDANWYGSAKIVFMASDPEGASASTTANFVVNSVNDAPIVQKIPNQIIDEKNEFEPISLTDYVADVDDDVTKLKWNISGNKDLIVSISDECIATIKTPNQYWTGSEDVTFTVSDPAGASAEATVKFIVKPGITVAPTDHGTVTVNDNAFEGETVKLTVTPDTGYVVKSVIVNDGAVHVTVNSDGTYSFTMPAAHVNVSVEFEKQRFTVTWKNGDTVLETDENVEYGTTPEYNGETPIKPMDDDYTYTFSGWSPEISSVEGDIEYTAQFTATARRGDCGANATWCFDPDTGKLTISGTGDMTDYNTPHDVPWYDIRNNIKSVIIENGITNIGEYTFYTCTSLESVTIPDSVTSIGYKAFQRCTGLTSIEIPDSVTSIGDYAFQICASLESIKIPEKVTSIGKNAFYSCKGITDVYCYADPANLTWGVDLPDFKSDGTTVCHVPAEHIDTYNSEKFSIVNVRFVGDLVDMGLGEHLYGHSITLDGSIGVNFYVELTDELLASETAEMVFTVPNGSKTDTQTLLVKDVIADESNKVSIGSKTYYKFRCSVSAKDMASTITAQLVDGESKGKEYTYSVKDYAEYILEHNEVEQYANAAPLVKAMLNYGAASQTYFGIEGTAANAELDDADKELGEVSIPDTFKFDDENATLPEGVTFEGATLSLKSETTLSLYFKGLADGTEFTCDSKTVETAKNGEYVVARIRGINASELENDFTVTFEGDSVTYNVTYNVMTYCYNVLNDGTVDDNLQNVCKALYKYAQAAINYAG